MPLEVKLKEYPVQVITRKFLVDGVIEASGTLIDSINEEGTGFLFIKKCRFQPFSPTNPIGAMATESITINKQEILLVGILQKEDQESISLLPKVEPFVGYIGDFVIKADFHMGGEMKLKDVLDTWIKQFVPVAKAYIFPSLPTSAKIEPYWPVLLINRFLVHHYHAEGTEAEWDADKAAWAEH